MKLSTDASIATASVHGFLSLSGVADIVQRLPNARYASIHQTPAFPYMGESLRVTGEYQNIMTIPIRPESTWTCGYRDAFAKALKFICSSSTTAASNGGEWLPDVVIICAGYDALDSDELASCSLQAGDYGKMVESMQQHLEQNCDTTKQPAILLGLEGGYQLSPFAGGGNLQQAVIRTLEAFL